MISVSNKIEILEVEGEDVRVGRTEILEVKNHPNYRHLVVLVVSGKSFAVKAQDLEAAIKNALNTAKY